MESGLCYRAGEGASSDVVGVRAAGRAPPPRGDAVLVGPQLPEAPVRQPLLEHQPGRAHGRRALDHLREAVTTLEETERIARRVFGGAHPTTVGLEQNLEYSRAALRARETRPTPSEPW